MNREIGALTGLRGIAALWVLAFHLILFVRMLPYDLQLPYRYFAGAGFLGVDIFFALSGFVLAYNYAGRRTHKSPQAWGEFLWKRIARIYPAHFAALILTGTIILVHIASGVAYLHAGETSINGLLRSLALIHAWDFSVAPTWNSASWSLSAEWAAYLCFPAIAFCVMRLRSAVIIVAMIAAHFAALYLLMTYTSWGDSMSYGLPRIAAEFTSGVLAWRLYDLGFRFHPRAAHFIAGLSLAGMFFVGNFVETFAFKSSNALYFLSVVIVFSMATAEGPLCKVLQSPIMQYLGRVSYSLYLVHYGFFLLAYNAIRLNWLFPATWLYIAGCIAALAASFACAHWFYVSIEEPARKSLLSLMTNRSRSPPMAVSAPTQ